MAEARRSFVHGTKLITNQHVASGYITPEVQGRMMEDSGSLYDLLNNERHQESMRRQGTNVLALPANFRVQLAIARGFFHDLGKRHAEMLAKDRTKGNVAFVKSHLEQMLGANLGVVKGAYNGGLLGVPRNVYGEFEDLYKRGAYDEYTRALGTENRELLEKLGLSMEELKRLGVRV